MATGTSPPGARRIPFVKMEGTGNDYVFVDGFEFALPDPAGLAPAISDRHRGVGSDGLILVLPDPVADARMRVFNADGSEAGMCGNGLRCVARLLWERGRAGERMAIAAGNRIVTARILLEDGGFAGVEVDLGRPEFRAAAIPAVPPDGAAEMVEAPLATSAGTVRGTAVSVGNPHFVVFDPALLADEPFARLGPELERHPAFPERVNVEFVDARDPERLVVRVWERGSGPTLACGSGACAVLAAAQRTGRAGRSARLVLPGGELAVTWTAEDRLLLAGPAEIVFEGVYFGGDQGP